MKKALISKKEIALKYDNTTLEGFRIVEVVEIQNEFDVHNDFEWIDCEDSITKELYYFNNKLNKIESYPLPDPNDKPLFLRPDPKLAEQPITKGTQEI
jgi:hypothetical protein